MAAPKVYLSCGSNLGDREANLKSAIKALGSRGTVVLCVSSIYETEPVGFLDQPWFLNIALELTTNLAAGDLLACCLDIEVSHGRIRSQRDAPRTLDLDILLYGDLVIDRPQLQIPHPRMTTRRFVLEPLAQIASQAVHPVLKQTIASLLAACTDRSSVVLRPELGPLF